MHQYVVSGSKVVGIPTLGFSLVTRFRIFSSLSNRPGSRGPLPKSLVWSAAAAARSFSSWQMSKYFLIPVNNEPFSFLSSFSLRISSSWMERSSSVCSSICLSKYEVTVRQKKAHHPQKEQNLPFPLALPSNHPKVW